MEWIDMVSIIDVLVMHTLGFEIEINDGKIVGIIGGERRREKLYDCKRIN